MATLFPDTYVHIGGDEINEAQWKANPAIQSFMRAHGFQTPRELHTYFNRRLLAILSSHGKKMIGWDEILTPDLPKTAVIQSWNGQKSLADAAVRGYSGILSFGYYLDHMKPAAYHYANDPLGAEAAALTPDQASHILGGEACMWTEYTSPQTVDSRIWPRLAVIAERLWSPADTKDEASMYARLEQVSRKLAWTGVQHLTATERLLMRIADDRPDPALQLLVDSVEAAGIHERYPSARTRAACWRATARTPPRWRDCELRSRVGGICLRDWRRSNPNRTWRRKLLRWRRSWRVWDKRAWTRWIICQTLHRRGPMRKSRCSKQPGG
jgi:hexosaminidase